MSRKYDKSYAGLAALMAENPEKAILRSFGKLNLLNLLFLQAELVHLEDDLNEAAESDNAAFAGDWSRLAHDDNGLQWSIVLKIRKVLNEYSMNAPNLHMLLLT
jgi:hypothetical protein